MSDIIRLLPDSVANQIAAGEVIQRPASVIKELVENSIDAGARTVTVILRDAGRTLIQVIDDGSGMSDTDARMAFERHATSKIQAADDLFALRTMGFRGEALASIAAIAQLDVRSQPHEASIGTRLLINGSHVESQAPEACSPGTNIMVKNLFFNVPARRKFLKKDSVELNNILREFERLALVNPRVAFNITHNDSLLHNLRPSSMKQRIVDLFGKNLDQRLLSVDTDTSIVKIHGFVCHPDGARRRNALQYLMVNGRNMRHPYFHKAIMMCYENLIAPDAQPNYFLNFTVDPRSIDVNIHPTKNEIKFENETAIWQILTAAVRESLGRFNGAPGMDFEAVDMIDIPAFSPDASAGHDIAIDPDYNPFKVSPHPTASQPRYQPDSRLRTTDWEKLYDDFARARSETISSQLNSSSAEVVGASDSEAIQIGGKYLLTPARDGVMVMDQHRASALILFNRYKRQVATKTVGIQRSIFPDTLQLSASQNAVMESILDSLGVAGFEVEKEGENEWLLTGSPTVLAGTTAKSLLLEIIDNVIETGEDPMSDFQNRLAAAMAQKAAIPYGQPLTVSEMATLISDLMALNAPSVGMDGKKVLAVIPVDQLGEILK